jgi:hypothetical protein
MHSFSFLVSEKKALTKPNHQPPTQERKPNKVSVICIYIIYAYIYI